MPGLAFGYPWMGPAMISTLGPPIFVWAIVLKLWWMVRSFIPAIVKMVEKYRYIELVAV